LLEEVAVIGILRGYDELVGLKGNARRIRDALEYSICFPPPFRDDLGQ
jgi:hypothetical protein